MKDRIAPYKYPRWLEFVPDLPKTATGESEHFRLRLLFFLAGGGWRRVPLPARSIPVSRDWRPNSARWGSRRRARVHAPDASTGSGARAF